MNTLRFTQDTALGYLIIYTLSDIAIPYSALETLATTTGFNPAYLPTPPEPYHAWQKATNLRRQKLIPPAALAEQVEAAYGCTPTVQAETRNVSPTTRHILRTVTIPRARSKNSQVDVAPVAVLRFDDNGLNSEEKFTSSYPHDDPMAAVNGNVDCLIYRMKQEYHRQLTTADGQDIRASVRKYLDRLGAILLSDGTYFAPAAGGLSALQSFILGLTEYKTGDSSAGSGCGVTCQVYPVVDDDSDLARQNRTEITRAAAAHFKKELGWIREQVQPDGRGTLASIERLKRAGTALEDLERRIGAFSALGDLRLTETIGRRRHEIKAAREALEAV